MSRSLCKQITSFLAMELREKAEEMERSGARVIHLSIGQPDFPTPECILDAADKAARDGHTGYTHSLGIYPLREAIAAYYTTQYGVSLSPGRVVVTSGTSPAMLMLFAVLLEKGEKVLLPDPTYACYANHILYAGAEPLSVPVAEADGFQLHVGALRQHMDGSVKAILVNSPSNPGGTIIPPADMRALTHFGPTLISDEIYHGLVYEGECPSALQFSEACCVLDGFSKRYAMTGWRLGWMVIPQDLVPDIQRLQQNFFICPGSVAQWAGLAALEFGAPHVARMAEEYNRRRVILLEGLRKLGFGVASIPAGAFYILANAKHLGSDSLALAYDILEKSGVALAPGIDFGPGGEGYLRFSYANSVENIEEAMHRLSRYLECC